MARGVNLARFMTIVLGNGTDSEIELNAALQLPHMRLYLTIDLEFCSP